MDAVEKKLNELRTKSGMERWAQLANIWPGLTPACQALVVQLAEMYFDALHRESPDIASTPVKSC